MAKDTRITQIDILQDCLGIQFEGKTMGDFFEREAMQNRMFLFMNSSENNWMETLYSQYLERRKKEPSLTAAKFLEPFIQGYKSRGVDIDKELCGIFDMETMGNVFDTYASLEGHLVIPSFRSSEKTKKVANEADMAYLYMDEMSRMISCDEALRAEYENGTSESRANLIKRCLKKIKKEGTLNNVDKKRVLQAQYRWRAYFRKSKDEAILCQMRDMGADISNTNGILCKFARAMGEVINIDTNRLSHDRTILRQEGLPLVEYDKDVSGFSRKDRLNQQILNKNEKDSLVEFGKIYPRATPAYKIAKMLQPFNTKAGLKFLEQIIESFNDVMVMDPWANNTSSPSR